MLVSTFGSIMLYSKSNRNFSQGLIKANIDALASGESGYTCSVSVNCVKSGVVYGSVSCTGNVKCEVFPKDLFNPAYVRCDGKITACK